MNKNEKMLKVRYEPGETGWAERIEPTIVRIDNVPMTNILNMDDVVEIEANGDERPTVKRLIKRVFSHKSVVYYRPVSRPTYVLLYKAFEGEGMKCEGAVPGVMVVAHNEKHDPKEVARLVGVEIKVEKIALRAPGTMTQGGLNGDQAN